MFVQLSLKPASRVITATLCAALATAPTLAQVDPAQRPATLPSYPDRPELERPRPRPPGVRPPAARPPIARPPYRPPIIQGGYYPPAGVRGFAGTLRCDSRNYQLRFCYARTQNHVVLERRYNGRCRFNRDWGYGLNRIWVNHNCRARFAYGYGNYTPRYRNDARDAALIIGGVAVAAGLVAILSDGGNSRAKASRFPPQTSAAIQADLSGVQQDAEPAVRQCLQRAAQNVAATGGSSLSLSDLVVDNLGRGTWRLEMDVAARYPDQTRSLAFSCTATASSIEDFDLITQ